MASNGLEMENALEQAIEASPSGVLIVDATGAIVLVNRELERQFGYTRAELIGQAVKLLLPESLGAVPAAHRDDFASDPVSRPVGGGRESVGRRKDGTEFPVEIGLRPISTLEGPFVLASISDLGERRRLEEAERTAADERLDFERLVAELSREFINVPAARIDDTIAKGLARIGEMLDLDRSTLYRLESGGMLVDCVSWTARDVRPIDGPVPAMKLFPWSLERVLAGAVVCFSDLREVPDDVDRRGYQSADTVSTFVVPLRVDGFVRGAVGFDAVRAPRTWAPEVIHRLKLMAHVFEQALVRQRREDALQAAIREAERLKDQLHEENVLLRSEEKARLGLTTHIVGQSVGVRRVFDQIHQVAATDSTVLLLGETGTGKELFATQIHELGARCGRPMVRVNCAAIPATLIESELFGREKGAFTGALARQIGRFELADHSTIFLDEIGDLPLDVQVKLLRVLEERQIERLGSPRPITVDTRIIAATHRNLEQRVAAGTFREDLYYRLNVFPIYVPPLRERVEDIPLLTGRFVEEFSKAFGKRIESIDQDSLAALQHYLWPGNIRELRNVVERAMIVATGKHLSITPPHASAGAIRSSARLLDVEREHIRDVLESTGWRIRGTAGAAERLGLKPTTLETRMAKLGLRRPVHA